MRVQIGGHVDAGQVLRRRTADGAMGVWARSITEADPPCLYVERWAHRRVPRDGIFGSPNMARTCQFAVNLLAMIAWAVLILAPRRESVMRGLFFGPVLLLALGYVTGLTLVLTGAVLVEIELDPNLPQRADAQDTGHHHGAFPAPAVPDTAATSAGALRFPRTRPRREALVAPCRGLAARALAAVARRPDRVSRCGCYRRGRLTSALIFRAHHLHRASRCGCYRCGGF